MDYVDGSSVYLYCRNEPIVFRDPYGTWVPPYDDSDVRDCRSVLEDAVTGGQLRGMPCASRLLYLFLWGSMTGKSVCPDECSSALNGADLTSAFSGVLKAHLDRASDCCKAGRTEFGDVAGTHCFGGSGDLFYAFKCVTMTLRNAACSWSCGVGKGTCCDCTATCGAEVAVSDTYDFCSSLAAPGTPGAGTGFGRRLAECGCIIEDSRRRNATPTNVFSVECAIGVKSQIPCNYRVCYPKLP